jgi:predicted 3-demethylubiquinone-9 3-methyltransferase (glyoxalase superfamily)
MKGITPCLWFENNAEEAVRFYTSVFKDGKIGTIFRHGKASAQASGQPEGSVMAIEFSLAGQDFLALNGGSMFKFTPAISLGVNCETQAEIDELWEQLAAGGEIMQCGWLTDKYGVTWQIVPIRLNELLKTLNAERTERVMQAMLGMVKLDIAELERAAG